MALWGNVDNAANSTIFALSQVNKNTANSTERTNLYNNTTANDYFVGATVGQFGVDANEVQALNAGTTGERPTHGGWTLRTEGSGGRAGRVFYETLVAMGSMTGDGSDDTQLPDYYIRIVTQPLSNTVGSGNSVNLTVVATSVPTGATLTYNWQKAFNGTNSNGPWINQPNVASVITNNTSPTLYILDNTTLNGNVYRVQISTTGGVTVTSANATITVT